MQQPSKIAHVVAGGATANPVWSRTCTTDHLRKHNSRNSRQPSARQTSYLRPDHAIRAVPDSRTVPHLGTHSIYLPQPVIGQPSRGEHSLDLDCRHFEECSGCSIANNVDSPPLLQRASAYFEGVCFHPPHPKAIWGAVIRTHILGALSHSEIFDINRDWCNSKSTGSDYLATA